MECVEHCTTSTSTFFKLQLQLEVQLQFQLLPQCSTCIFAHFCLPLPQVNVAKGTDGSRPYTQKKGLSPVSSRGVALIAYCTASMPSCQFFWVALTHIVNAAMILSFWRSATPLACG
eukprot:NODE_1210_length_1783_cov_0.026128.p3 type:complete len:117 gc:universal NODE_1210_length_1783_cov_0.026128:1657-1307(-)